MKKIILNNEIKNSKKNVAIVINTFVNGLHIIRSLSKKNIPIIALDTQDTIGLHSKYLTQSIIYDEKENGMDVLLEISKQLNKKGVLFPTNDKTIKLLYDNYDKLKNKYYIPINPKTSDKILSKKYQYELCEKLEIPYPKTLFLNNEQDICKLRTSKDELMYPLIVKPYSSEGKKLFRNKEINDQEELLETLNLLKDNIHLGFVISEVIPGEPSNLWSCGSYYSNKSIMLSSWTGKKLTQRPYYYGVFSVAKFEKNNIVKIYSKKILDFINYHGISQVEFKYDKRDNKYKLIEINPRYWMWHGLALKDNINLPLIHYYSVIDNKYELSKLKKTQSENNYYIVFLFYEMLNLLYHKPKSKYINNLIKSLSYKNKIWAIYDKNDKKPFFHFIKTLFKNLTVNLFNINN